MEVAAPSLSFLLVCGMLSISFDQSLLLTLFVFYLSGFSSAELENCIKEADVCDFDAWVTNIGCDGIMVHESDELFDKIEQQKSLS